MRCPDCGLADRSRWRTACLWRDPPGCIGADAPCYLDAFDQRVRERENAEDRAIARGLALFAVLAALVGLVVALV